MSEKLQKVIAKTGLASRREVETWILAGRVRVNDHVAKIGERVESSAQIYIDGKAITPVASVATRVWMYNKPEGEICTRHDDQNRTTVFERLPSFSNERFILIGRLDLNTQGLLLLTNQGELANRLMHPSYQIPRRYAVRICGEVDALTLERLQKGIALEDGMARFEKIVRKRGKGVNGWYEVLLREGRNRLVRRLWESQGFMVSRLIRVGFAGMDLPRTLHLGEWSELNEREVKKLTSLVHLN